MRPSSVQKTFSVEEFAELLGRAARHLVDRCREVYCEAPVPSAFAFVLPPDREAEPPSRRRLVDAVAAASVLVRPDGTFCEWVNLSPLGIAHNRIVIELDYASRFSARLLTGDLRTASSSWSCSPTGLERRGAGTQSCLA